MGRTVWTVCQDETPHNTVLGVFETEAEARDLADQVQGRFPQGVIHFSWVVGARYDEGSGYST
jgi:hypothetical protein